MTTIDTYKYYPFCLALFLFQILGYNVITLAILAISFLPITSLNEFFDRLKTIPFFFFYLTLSLTTGIYFALAHGIYSWNIPYWGQYYFFSFILLAIRDKKQCIMALKYCVMAIFIGDFLTNILLITGFDVPWSPLPPLRAGESMLRYGGIKGSALYSGSITFIAICYFLQEKNSRTILRSIFLACMVINMILSGSYRYFIISIVIFALYYFSLYKYRILLFLTYMGSIIIVYFLTKYTMFLSLSNFMRYMIWDYYIGEVMIQPIIGHGFMNMHLNDVSIYTYQILIANGVTESCILLVAYCFGLPILCLFFISIIRTLQGYQIYKTFHTELALFLGLSLDLFWGGSFDNSLSISVLTLSWYSINERRFEYHSLAKSRNDEN